MAERDKKVPANDRDLLPYSRSRARANSVGFGLRHKGVRPHPLGEIAAGLPLSQVACNRCEGRGQLRTDRLQSNTAPNYRCRSCVSWWRRTAFGFRRRKYTIYAARTFRSYRRCSGKDRDCSNEASCRAFTLVKVFWAKMCATEPQEAQ